MQMPSCPPDSSARPRLLVDFWYASELKGIATPFLRRQRGSLREDHKSSGQVRLGAAIELDVPVVASEVEGLKGYLRHGVNALAFPAGDSVSLRNQVAQLLADAEARRALTASARSACEGYDRSAYFRELALRVERAQRVDRG